MYSINSVLHSSVGSFMLRYPKSVTVLVMLNILNVITYKTFSLFICFFSVASLSKKKIAFRVKRVAEMETEVLFGIYRQGTVMGSSSVSFSVLPL